MRQQGPHHTGNTRRFPNFGQLSPMRNQPAPIQRDPFTRIGSGLVGEPLQFFTAFIHRLPRFPTLRLFLVFDGEDDGVMFR